MSHTFHLFPGVILIIFISCREYVLENTIVKTEDQSFLLKVIIKKNEKNEKR